MIIRVQDGKIRAFESYKYKDQLKAIGFKYDWNGQNWYITSNEANAYNLYKELDIQNNPTVYTCVKTKQLIRTAEAEHKKRQAKLDALKNRKINLFLADDLPVGDFKVPEGISLYNHQKIALNFFYESEIGNLYGDCGVGKTAIMLLLLERLIREGKSNKILVLCPKSIMRGAWEEDAEKFTPQLDLCVLDKGTKVNKIILQKDFEGHPKYRKQYDKSFQIYVLNYEALAGLMDVIPYYGFDVLVCDEASKLKSHKSSITKNTIKLSKHFKRKYIISGTPAPNHELEYFGQMAVLDEKIFGKSFYRFRSRWFEPVGFMGFQYDLDPMLEDEFVEQVYTYGLRFRQQDCVDLPDVQFLELPSYMDKKTTTAYKTLVKEKILEFQNRTIPVSNPLAEMTKLRQLTSSHMTTDEELVTYKNHKLDTLKEFLEANPGEQAVIWATFIYDIEQIKELLGDKAGCLYGKTTTNELNEFTKKFKAGELQYLICNPQSVAHGHTWTNASLNIFYSLNYSNELYEQARKRTHRIGQTEKVRYYHVLSKTADGMDTVDHVVYSTVRGKITRSNEIMDMFKKVAL
jgi:SNF2 family DNA or RNA helicase